MDVQRTIMSAALAGSVFARTADVLRRCLQNPSTPPTTPLMPDPLTSLPSEVFTLIASFTDLPTARALALVSRACLDPAQRRLWRSIDIMLPRYFGRYPQELPFVPVSHNDQSWANEDWGRVHAIREDGILRKVEGIIHMISKTLRSLPFPSAAQPPDRWCLTRELNIELYAAATDATMTLLRLLSPSLISLSVNFPLYSIPNRSYALDFGTSAPQLCFPALKHIQLGSTTLRHIESIPLLFEMAPNLAELVLDLYVHPSPWRPIPPIPISRPFARPTRLRWLQLSAEPSGEECDKHTAALKSLLQHSPLLEQLSLCWFPYTGQEGLVLAQGLLAIIGGYTELRDLMWECDLDLLALPSADTAHGDGMSSWARVSDDCPLRQCIGWTSIGHVFPNLELLYIEHYDPPAPLAPSSSESQDLAAQSLIPEIISLLRRCLRLRFIHRLKRGKESDRARPFDRLDDCEAAGSISGSVRSYHHAGSELLHIRIESDAFEVLDGLLSDEPEDETEDDALETDRIEYVASDGTRRFKHFERRPFAMWQDYTDWNGLVVPLEVLQEMRRVDGRSEAEWEGRGIEVGEAAWQVLLNWKEEGAVAAGLNTASEGSEGSAAVMG